MTPTTVPVPVQYRNQVLACTTLHACMLDDTFFFPTLRPLPVDVESVSTTYPVPAVRSYDVRVRGRLIRGRSHVGRLSHLHVRRTTRRHCYMTLYKLIITMKTKKVGILFLLALNLGAWCFLLSRDAAGFQHSTDSHGGISPAKIVSGMKDHADCCEELIPAQARAEKCLTALRLLVTGAKNQALAHPLRSEEETAKFTEVKF